MKKRILLLAAVFILFVSACAEESGLTAAFARGPKLIEVETDFSSFPGDMSGAYVVSMSPDGRGSIVVSDDAVYTVYEGNVSELHASYTRGVPDDYGNLEHACDGRIRKGHTLSGKYGIVWSHNGRYAVPLYTEKVQTGIDWSNDPFIIDTETGEMYLAATHPNGGQVGSCALTSAVFNEDDSLLYYELYGYPSPYRSTLACCDLENNTEKRLYSSPHEYCYPNQSILKNGCLLMMWSAINADEADGITCVRKDSFGSTDRAFSLPIMNWYGLCMEYSEDSGLCIVLGFQVMTRISFSFQCFRPDDGFAGMNEYWAIASDLTSVVKLDTEELTAPYGDDSPYRSIVWMVLSPDGEYALALCGEKGADGQKLVLIDLNQMTCAPVDGPASTAEDIAARVYPPMIEWNDDVLMGVNGEVRRFRIG